MGETLHRALGSKQEVKLLTYNEQDGKYHILSEDVYAERKRSHDHAWIFLAGVDQDWLASIKIHAQCISEPEPQFAA